MIPFISTKEFKNKITAAKPELLPCFQHAFVILKKIHEHKCQENTNESSPEYTKCWTKMYVEIVNEMYTLIEIMQSE